MAAPHPFLSTSVRASKVYSCTRQMSRSSSNAYLIWSSKENPGVTLTRSTPVVNEASFICAAVTDPSLQIDEAQSPVTSTNDLRQAISPIRPVIQIIGWLLRDSIELLHQMVEQASDGDRCSQPNKGKSWKISTGRSSESSCRSFFVWDGPHP